MAEAIIRGIAYAFDDDGPRRPTLPVRNMEAELASRPLPASATTPRCEHCGVEMAVKRGPQVNYFCDAPACAEHKHLRANDRARQRYAAKAAP